LAGDRRRAGASAHTEPFRAHRAAPSTCEAGATKHQEQSDCAFGYYKEFMDSSYTVQQPPVAVSCKTPVKWLENQCLTANRGVEYDWMNFLYDINSAPSSQRTSLSNLWQVYLTACSPPECESENLSWSALDNGAKAYYGTNNLRYLKLVASGSNFGVNH